jgi:hypothetical protein
MVVRGRFFLLFSTFRDENQGASDRLLIDAPIEAAPTKKPKFTKNPEVDTSFLPDRDRESRERLEREQLRKEWLEKQEKIKAEGIEITYSYWDGSGHRKSVEVSLVGVVRVQASARERAEGVGGTVTDSSRVLMCVCSARRETISRRSWESVGNSFQNCEVSAWRT